MQVWLLVLALLAPLPAASQLPATSLPVSHPVVYELARMSPAAPALKARAALVVDLDSGTVLYQLDSHGRHAPASLTKVMRLDQVVTVPSSINQLPWDSTRMGLRPGEQVSVRDLLYGLFLNSGNDAAITLSEAVMPRASFVARMNARAAALGMTDTHFVNPIGLDEPAHFSSAADLAKAAVALRSRFPEVAAMGTIQRLTLAATTTHHAYNLYNLNELIRTYPGATGLKTGWTGRAGGCLIATASREGRQVLVVVMGSPQVFKEAATLLDYGFTTAL
jgi:serine-type D-Ala-D-Ala carboxypeptidase (penicillin-binding protein 5/6)